MQAKHPDMQAKHLNMQGKHFNMIVSGNYDNAVLKITKYNTAIMNLAWYSITVVKNSKNNSSTPSTVLLFVLKASQHAGKNSK
jgi:hypothetical protein